MALLDKTLTKLGPRTSAPISSLLLDESFPPPFFSGRKMAVARNAIQRHMCLEIQGRSEIN